MESTLKDVDIPFQMHECGYKRKDDSKQGKGGSQTMYTLREL